ncbi:MAG: putative toxin-antitoxin system toxin component, PIN family [Oscillospiraceae bacterium]|nr:putative toxin-antitoxin system toxin component, PIN family [Oscillospiraceae bacterium]
MKVLIDTNILISAIYKSGSVPHQAYKKAIEPPYRAMICEFSLNELQRVFNRKFPQLIDKYEKFIATALMVVQIVPVPLLVYDDEEKIRDVKDRPILRAAIKAGADILVSGDKDFLESSVAIPKIMRAAEFLNL